MLWCSGQEGDQDEEYTEKHSQSKFFVSVRNIENISISDSGYVRYGEKLEIKEFGSVSNAKKIFFKTLSP